MGDKFAQSFTLKIGRNWEVQRRMRDTLGYEPKWGWYNRETYLRFQKNFLLAIPRVFERHGFPGTVIAVGEARRPSKGAWEFTMLSGNIRITENFILAKLMGLELFEEDVWREAVAMTVPDLVTA